MLLSWSRPSPSWAEPAAQPPHQVLVVALPRGSEGHDALASRISRTAIAAGVEPVALEDREVALSPETIQEAARLEEEAAQHELNLETGAAAEVRQRIVEALERDGAAATEPGRLAAALARLAATQVEAEQPSEAVRLFRRALALRADLTLDATYSPRTREAFEQARAQGATLPPRPGRAALDRLCEITGTEAVLWAAVGYDEGDPVLVLVFHRPGTPETPEVRQALGQLLPGAELDLPEGVVAGLERDLASLVPPPPIEPPPPVEPPPVEPPPPPPRRPFWRTWWFSTIIGVAVAGATAVGLGVGLAPGDREATLRLRMHE